jgi:hypothetical protein
LQRLKSILTLLFRTEEPAHWWKPHPKKTPKVATYDLHRWVLWINQMP